MALVVENDERTRPLVVRLMHCFGFDAVAEAADGRQALTLLSKRHDVDLILTDLDMPRMSGLDLVRRLRQAGNQTPIIMLSARDDRDLIQEARRAGITAYLPKPVNPDALATLIRRTLAAADRITHRSAAKRQPRSRKGAA